MKIKNPFDMAGWLEIDAQYHIGNRKSKFDLSSKGNATNTQKSEWDSFTLIETAFAVEYTLIKPPIEACKGKFGFSADWNASFSDKGVELSQVGVQPRDLFRPSSDGAVVVAANVRLGQSKLRDKTPFVQMVVDIVAGYTSDGFSIGLRGGPFSAGISLGGSKGGGKDVMEIKLILDMEQPADVVTPMPKIPRDLLKVSAYFGKKDEDKLPSASLTTLDHWEKAVSKIEALHKVITVGQCVIYLEGNTSKSGSKDYNAKLAKRRIEAVVRALNQRFGSPTMSYSKEPKAQSKYEEENDYRVDIYFKKDEAEKAIDRMGYRTGPP